MHPKIKTSKTSFLILPFYTATQLLKRLTSYSKNHKLYTALKELGNSSEFMVATAEEQNIANNSKRLIQNTIILWNYMFITKKLQQAPNQKEKDEILYALKNSVIVAFLIFYIITNFAVRWSDN